jgi:hypothetical protein
MLLKLRSRKHHPHMYYSYTEGRRKIIPFHLDPPKNVLLLHWEKTPKIFLLFMKKFFCYYLLVSINMSLILIAT